MSASRHMRRGFTLVEAMIAVSIFLIVSGGLVTFFFGVRNLTVDTLANAELSLRGRQLRERLLFHVAPPHHDTLWSGLLSGTRVDGSGSTLSVVEGGVKILMNEAYGYSTAASCPVSQRIELLVRSESDGATTARWPGNDADRTDDAWPQKWLRPGGGSNLPAQDWFDDTRLAAENVLVLNLELAPNDMRAVRIPPRRERIVLPLFGKVATPGGTVFRD